MGRELPQREASLFKTILKNYELKQYKKGFKIAEQILKKIPEHGETLAMKGLFLSHLDKKEEGYAFVRKGLAKDLQSHICWHVFGLLHRADKNYEEAAKCYSHALKYDKANQQILRDFSLLQIQMRNYDGHADTRIALLKARSNFRVYWTGYAVSQHLLGEYEAAEHILTTSESVMKGWNESVSQMAYEYSEMLLYKNMIIAESGDIERALRHLEEIEDKVCDRVFLKEQRAQYLMKMGRNEEAGTVYESLIGDNPNRIEYFKGYQSCKNMPTGSLTPEQETGNLKFFQDLKEKYPYSNAATRLALPHASGDNFRNLVDKYMRRYLQKGSPSLFVNLKSLYTDSNKVEIMEELIEGYLSCLKQHQQFTSDNASDKKEPPSALIFTMYLAVRHYDRKGQVDRALAIADEAIEHTPTFLELHMAKALIYKHAGDFAEAAACMDRARKLDLQDRFVNSKCVKYMLRANRIKDAETTAALFTRADNPTDPLNDLIEMQAMWFELESAAAHARVGEIDKALTRYHQIEGHFLTITDDQFDFHMYCLKKGTLRQYINLLRFEDQLRSHSYYFKAAQEAIKIYIGIFDLPKVVRGDKPEWASLSEAERKKARNKARKAELKAQKDVEPKKGQDDVKEKKQTTPSNNTEQYAKTEDPLGKALEFLKPLQELAAERVETQLLSFDIYIRQKKYLLALKALKKAIAIDANHPEICRKMIRVHREVNLETSELNPIVREVAKSEVAAMLGKFSCEQYLKNTLASNKTSIPHIVAVAETMLLLNSSMRTEALSLLTSVGGPSFELVPSMANCVTVYKSLSKTFGATQEAELFKKKVAERHPHASALDS